MQCYKIWSFVIFSGGSGGRGCGAPGGQYRGRRRSCMTLPLLVPKNINIINNNNNNNNNSSYNCYSDISLFVSLYSGECLLHPLLSIFPMPQMSLSPSTAAKLLSNFDNNTNTNNNPVSGQYKFAFMKSEPMSADRCGLQNLTPDFWQQTPNASDAILSSGFLWKYFSLACLIFLQCSLIF